VISVRSELTWRWDDRSTVERSDPHVPVAPRG
jgi:hypothetical protein